MEVVTNTHDKTLLRMKHLTDKLSLSKSTIWLWIRNNEFPKPNKVNGVSFWKADTIEKWIDEHTEQSNKEEEN
jgi:predicted DNA-binding transcriptional regulator AlpA|tara:strand:+ start:2539 stop:2757 length:219 start_codon:yes stop_codon:yes gene_type:complete